MFVQIIVIIASYLLGAIPSAYVFSKIFGGINIMEHGSGNVGATNTFRILGWKVGSMVFAFDMFKGFFAAFLGSLVSSMTFAVVCALVAIFGHTFSIFIKFKGGKGAATGAGALLFISPLSLLIVITVWFLVAFITGYISLASMVAAVSAVIVLALFHAEPIVIVLVSLVAVYIIFKHRSNIKRLINGTENKNTWKKKVFGKK